MHSQLHWLHLEKRICESSAFLQKCIYSYIGCFCKKNSQCQWSLASQENRIAFVSSVVCFDQLGPKFLIRARQLKKGTKCDSNGGHLHARKGEDQVQRPPDLPDRSRMMLACTCCPSCVCSQLTFSLLISELFISIAIGTSSHFHCQLPTEA